MLLSQLPLTSHQIPNKCPFHYIACNYTHIDWDVPWEDIFKLSASAATSKLCGWIQVRIDVCILIITIRSSLTHVHGFQLLVLLPEFIENTFFCFYQQNKLWESKVKFRQAINCCKRVLKVAKIAYANITKESITSQKSDSSGLLANCK